MLVHVYCRIISERINPLDAKTQIADLDFIVCFWARGWRLFYFQINPNEFIDPQEPKKKKKKKKKNYS